MAKVSAFMGFLIYILIKTIPIHNAIDVVCLENRPVRVIFLNHEIVLIKLEFLSSASFMLKANITSVLSKFPPLNDLNI